MSSRTVQELLQNHPKPVTISLEATVQQALELMFENGYSQLPITDPDNKLLGIISNASILTALQHFRTTIDRLSVRDALDQPQTCSTQDDLFELLDTLSDVDVVVVVDPARGLEGLITAHDAVKYLRDNAEDLMFVADFETLLKDYIEIIYPDEQARAGQLQIVANRQGRFQDQAKKLLIEYLKLGNGGTVKFNQAWFREACGKLDTEPVQFDELTLNDYIELWLHSAQWEGASSKANLDVQNVRDLLRNVRDTRNDLAHLRPISREQRKQLRYSAKWLERYSPTRLEPESLPTEQITIREAIATVPDTSTSALITAEIEPTDEEVESESRYAALANWLQNVPYSEKQRMLRFDEIESIIDHPLPPTARQHRSWWANDSVGHVQSQERLSAGWRVSNLSITNQTVTFSRIIEREQAYIKFFSAYKNQLSRVADFAVKDSSPSGQSWFNTVGLPFSGPQLGTITATFAQGKRFRIELYIDTGYQDKNKHVFDELQKQQADFEAQMGGKLGWERLENKRAARVALYYKKSISITDPESELEPLRTWAVNAIIMFYKAFAARADELLGSGQ